MFTLYTLTADIQLKLNELEHVGVDTPEGEEIFDELEALFAHREAKHVAYIHVIRNAEAAAQALKAEAREFQARANSAEALAKQLKHRLMSDMAQHDEPSTEAGMFKLRRRLSPPAVHVLVPTEALPSEFHKVTVTPDKAALKAALAEGRNVEGAELKQGEHLRIQVK